MPQLAAFASRRSEFPDWVLLGLISHIGRGGGDDDDYDVATAWSRTSKGSPIKVSFVPADPPALTRCFVHCADLIAADFVKSPPCIIAADGAFLLIRMFLPRCRSHPVDYFVFNSGPGAPSLDLLPRPYPVARLSGNPGVVGVLSCGEHCLVIVSEWQLDAKVRSSYHLHVFSSKTKSWSSKVARLPQGMDDSFCIWFEPTMVFAVDGGSMAWVDLQHGILLCDSVAGEHPEVRPLICLPPLMPVNYYPGCTLDSVLDVTFRNGWFRSIEVGHSHLDDGNGQIKFQWTLTKFKMMVSSEECQWEPCGTVDSVDLSTADSCFPDSLPEVWYSEDNKLTLSNVVSIYPTLDQDDDDMVYMMAKISGTYQSGWMLAINTANKKLERISPFTEETLHISRIFLHGDFFKHQGTAPGTLDKCTDRGKIELLKANLLAALDQLQNMETHVESLNRRYDASMSLSFSGAASYLDPKIPTDTECGSNIGRGTDAAGDCLRSMGDLRLQLLDSIGEIKGKLTVAHGALYNNPA